MPTPRRARPVLLVCRALVLFVLLAAACGEPDETPLGQTSAQVSATAGAAGAGEVEATATFSGAPPTFDAGATATFSPEMALTATRAAERYDSSYFSPPMATAIIAGEPALPTDARQVTDAVSATWGRYGDDGGDALDAPHGIAVDSLGRVLVVDTNHSRVAMFDMAGAYLGDFAAGPGTSAGQLQAPVGICVDAAGAVYVSEVHPGRVQKFDADGAFMLEWGLPLPDAAGTVMPSQASLAQPWSLACAADGSVIVADTSAWRIARYNAEGQFLNAWQPDEGRTIAPIVAVAVAPEGAVYIGSLLDASIEAYDLDGVPRGSLIDGPTLGTLAFVPWNLLTDAAGNLYVNDIRNQRVLKLDPQGAVLAELRLADNGLADAFIYGMALDPEGQLLLTVSNAGYDGAIPYQEYDAARPGRVDRVVVVRAFP